MYGCLHFGSEEQVCQIGCWHDDPQSKLLTEDHSNFIPIKLRQNARISFWRRSLIPKTFIGAFSVKCLESSLLHITRSKFICKRFFIGLSCQCNSRSIVYLSYQKSLLSIDKLQNIHITIACTIGFTAIESCNVPIKLSKNYNKPSLC